VNRNIWASNLNGGVEIVTTSCENPSRSCANVAIAALLLSFSVQALLVFGLKGKEDASSSLKGIVILFRDDGTSGVVGASRYFTGGGSSSAMDQSGKLKFRTRRHIGDRGGSLNVLQMVVVVKVMEMQSHLPYALSVKLGEKILHFLYLMKHKPGRN
jgi:hypothetical protein